MWVENRNLSDYIDIKSIEHPFRVFEHSVGRIYRSCDITAWRLVIGSIKYFSPLLLSEIMRPTNSRIIGVYVASNLYDEIPPV